MMGTKSRENIREYLRNLLFSRRSSEVRGSPGESICENLKLVFSKNRLTRIEEGSESQSKGRGIKDPNTSRWRRGPMGHTAMLVKVFQRLDSTSAKELERGIPTGSRL